MHSGGIELTHGFCSRPTDPNKISSMRQFRIVEAVRRAAPCARGITHHAMSEHSQHYEEVSDHYDSSIFYAEGPYVDWQRAECARHLALGESGRREPRLRLRREVADGGGRLPTSLGLRAPPRRPPLREREDGRRQARELPLRDLDRNARRGGHQLLDAGVVSRHGMRSAEELLEWLEARNEALGARSDAEWEEARKTAVCRAKTAGALETALAKSSEHAFYLGLTQEWLNDDELFHCHAGPVPGGTLCGIGRRPTVAGPRNECRVRFARRRTACRAGGMRPRVNDRGAQMPHARGCDLSASNGTRGVLRGGGVGDGDGGEGGERALRLPLLPSLEGGCHKEKEEEEEEKPCSLWHQWLSPGGRTIRSGSST